MLAGIADWNGTRHAERHGADEPEIRLSIGIHHGPATLGNVGSERRLEFAVLGDTVNVAARLEELTRPLDCRMAISEALVGALEAELGDGAANPLAGFVPRGPQAIRGRDQPIEVRTLGG